MTLQKYILKESTKTQIPTEWYHGSNELFDQFNISYIGRNFKHSTLGIYFTSTKFPPPYSSSAQEYANDLVERNGGEPYIYVCKIQYKNPLYLNSYGYYNANAYIDIERKEIEKETKNNNYNCVIVYDHNDPSFNDYILVTKNTNLIKIINVEKL